MKKQLLQMVKSDNEPFDVTSAILDSKNCSVIIISKENCVLSGLDEVKFLFESAGCKTFTNTKDGQRIRKNSTILKIEGNNQVILGIERIALNVLGKMSGISTLCFETKKLIKNNVKLAMTRKTTPGFNDFEKKAAEIVGVLPHRKNLGDGVLIKDNHLFFFDSIKKALQKAKSKKYSHKIEIEVESFEQAKLAAENGADIILLDNFSVEKAKKTINFLREHFSKIVLEVSGGINKENLLKFAECEPDYISMGFLSKNAKMFDFSMEVLK